MKKVGLLAFLIVMLSGLGLSSQMALGQEKLQFGAAFKGSPRYDLLAWVAENKGFWKDQGLKVDWIPFQGSSLMFRTLAAGKMFIGVSDIASFVRGAAKEVPVIIVADLKTPQYFSLWVKGDSPIKTGKDLKDEGGRIGISRKGGASHAYSILLSRRLGVEKDVKIISLRGFRERIAAIRSGAIEAFIQTLGPVANMAATGDLRAIATSKDLLPADFIDFVVFSDKGFLKRKRNTVARVTKAVVKAALFIANNPDWTKKKLQKDFNYTPEGAELSMTELKFAGAGTPITAKAMASTVNFFFENKIIKKAPEVEGLYTNEFVK